MKSGSHSPAEELMDEKNGNWLAATGYQIIALALSHQVISSFQ
jgi:hypothetical protein